MSILAKLFGNKKSTTANVSDLIALLADNNHDVRKKAIEALAACHYQDPEESRSYQILESAKNPSTHWDPNDLKADLENFSDFSVVYLRAAYPTGYAEDHLNAKVSILYDGLLKAKTKGDILANMAKYYLYSGKDDLKALDYATAAVLLGDPRQGPGSMVDVLVFLAKGFDRVGLRKIASLAREIKAPYALGSEEAAWIESNALVGLHLSHEKEIEWAAKLLEGRLRSVKKKM